MTLRCVIVDDSRALLHAAGDLLQRQGIAVVGVATTGEEALGLLDRLEPDVILVDIDLRGESGFDLSRRLAQAAGTTGACSILISAHDEADFADLIAASPAIGFVSKAELSATALHRLLARAQDEGRD